MAASWRPKACYSDSDGSHGTARARGQIPCFAFLIDVYTIIKTVVQNDTSSYDVCNKIVNTAASIPLDAADCAFNLATAGEAAVAERGAVRVFTRYTKDWFVVRLVNDAAITLPARLAAWAGCTRGDGAGTSTGVDYPEYGIGPIVCKT